MLREAITNSQTLCPTQMRGRKIGLLTGYLEHTAEATLANALYL